MPTSKRTKKTSLQLTAPPIPGQGRLEYLYNELMQRPNVVGCFIGRKQKKGRDLRSLSIVCVVSQKLPKKELAPGVDLLPEAVQWPTGSTRQQSIPTDVQEVSAFFTPAAGTAVTGPGDDLVLPGSGPIPTHATVGFAMQHPFFGHVVTTAGHLLLRSPGEIIYTADTRPRLVLANAVGAGQTFRGIALKAVVTDTADYALIMPEKAAPPANLFRDTHPLAEAYLPSAADVGASLLVLTGNGPKPARFVGVAATLPAGLPGVMRRLLVTNFATAAGDSGSCLVDARSRVWGVLVGAGAINGKPYSLFTSSVVPLARERATFL